LFVILSEAKNPIGFTTRFLSANALLDDPVASLGNFALLRMTDFGEPAEWSFDNAPAASDVSVNPPAP
jgi:hypothetical protein